MDTPRIALDVMGGDEAPRAILKGALRACSNGGGVDLAPERVLLVGVEEVIEAGLEELGGNPGFAVQPASQVVEMHEKPAVALRAKPDSSIAGCIKAVREGAAGAVLSMGNTGAVVGASTLGLRTLPGVKRPGIAVTLTLTGQHLTIIDMGANIAPRPEHLLQYGQMGSVLMRECLDCAEPRIGLLNIGEEESKGTELLQAAHKLLRGLGESFIGNIEGGDIFRNRADVVVTDGFTGNVILKLVEQYSTFMMKLVLGELKQQGVDWAPDVLGRLRKSVDYAEYGGALLLGVAGVVVIGHGRSDEVAVSNALGLAARTLDARVNENIVQGLERANGEGVAG